MGKKTDRKKAWERSMKGDKMQNIKSIYKYVVFGSLMAVGLLFIDLIGPVMGPRGDSLIFLVSLYLSYIYSFP